MNHDISVRQDNRIIKRENRSLDGQMIFHMRQDLLTERFDDQVLLFDPDNNLPYILNPVAAYILMNTDGSKSQETIAEMLYAEFDVEFHRALEDIKLVYNDLLEKELITPVC